MANLIKEPAILTANTYYWNPAHNAAGRRKNEEKRQEEAYDFFDSLGLNVERNGDSVIATGCNLEVVFSYKETCGNVYKHLLVEKSGKKSNITSLRKLMNFRNARISKIDMIINAA